VDRRQFLAITGGTAVALGNRGLFTGSAWAVESAAKADFTIGIGPVTVELAPGRVVETIGYNGTSPGPILRMREGKEISVDVFNHTDVAELVHWPGQFIPSEVDGSAEEGTPAIPAHGHRRYTFTPGPSGTRWYHAHAMAGRNLRRSLYTGQFGFVYVEPSNDPGRYDQEAFLALREWEPFFTNEEEEEEEGCSRPDGAHVQLASYKLNPARAEKGNGLEVGYKEFSINNHGLGHGEPIRVRQGERVLMHILNASATEIRRIALPGHKFTVVALDGNPVPVEASVEVLEIAPAERVDAIVQMDQPGVWILGTTNDEDRQGGMGIAIEYTSEKGPAKWVTPPKTSWDYTIFGNEAPQSVLDETFHLVFRKIPGGKGGFNQWTISSKSFPHTDPLVVHEGRRYRLIFDNQSDNAHPFHLHRHSFELIKVNGKGTGGILKDTVVVKPYKQVEATLVADHPGLTLFHCHQQLHMDFGFMTLLKYA
jgi:FtsP/CotA-like multicopper oxidase with cupredoxin domain